MAKTSAMKNSPVRPKKDVRWDEDEEILKRLAVVASMMTQGASTLQIANALSFSIRTAYRDIARVKELWKRKALESVDDSRAASIATYLDIKTEAYAEYRRTKALGKPNLGCLKIVMEAEANITLLQGSRKPAGIDVTSNGETVGNAIALNDEELAKILKQ